MKLVDFSDSFSVYFALEWVNVFLKSLAFSSVVLWLAGYIYQYLEIIDSLMPTSKRTMHPLGKILSITLVLIIASLSIVHVY